MHLETRKPPFTLDRKLLGVSVSTDIGTQGSGGCLRGSSEVRGSSNRVVLDW